MACARGSVIALLAALSFSRVSAEITLDGTMGPAGPLPGPDFTIPDTAGTTLSANLFHSFSVFNIDSTESATFTGPAGLDNVISRVTGGAPSSIDGLFRSTVPGADIFFVNPAGVVFGPNAALDVPGAFHTSTADELRFSDGNVFSASDPGATVLTPAAPEAFGFLGDNPAAISVNDSRLEVPAGERLALVGGDVTVEGTSTGLAPYLVAGEPSDPIVVNAPGGRIDLVSVASPGEVTIGPGGLEADGFAAYRNIQLKDSVISVSADASGDIYIRGGEVRFDRASALSITTNGDGGDITLEAETVSLHRDAPRVVSGENVPRILVATTGTGNAGDVQIDSASLSLVGGIHIWNQSTGAGEGGDIYVNTGPLEVRDTGMIGALADGSGPSGDVVINAETIEMSHEVASQRDTAITIWSAGHNLAATGNGGKVIIKSGTIDVSGVESRLGPFTQGSGRAGDLVLNAERLTLREGAVVDSSTEGTGAAGNIEIKVLDLEIRSAATIVSGGFFGGGDAGDIRIDASNILLSADGRFDTETNILAISVFSGDAGDIDITTGHLEIRGGNIATRSIAGGDSGDITISADSVLLDGGGNILPAVPPNFILEHTAIIANAAMDISGDAGNIEITANSVEVRGGAAIDSSIASPDAGGSVTIQANEIFVHTDGRIDTGTNGDGDGGSINLMAKNVSLADGGNIVANSTGSGLAGDIVIEVSDAFQSSGGFISTEALASDGGNITINAVRLVDLLDSRLTTSVGSGAGAGGNITIDPRFVIVQNSQIIANAFGGPGGNINITAELFLVDASSVISASSALGIDGVINIESPVSDVTSGVTKLPAEVLDASSLVQAPCAARATAGASSLTSAGRSGLPAGPDGYLPSPGPGLATHAPTTVGLAATTPAVSDTRHGVTGLYLAVPGLGCS